MSPVPHLNSAPAAKCAACMDTLPCAKTHGMQLSYELFILGRVLRAMAPSFPIGDASTTVASKPVAWSSAVRLCAHFIP